MSGSIIDNSGLSKNGRPCPFEDPADHDGFAVGDDALVATLSVDVIVEGTVREGSLMADELTFCRRLVDGDIWESWTGEIGLIRREMSILLCTLISSKICPF